MEVLYQLSYRPAPIYVAVRVRDVPYRRGDGNAPSGGRVLALQTLAGDLLDALIEEIERREPWQ